MYQLFEIAVWIFLGGIALIIIGTIVDFLGNAVWNFKWRLKHGKTISSEKK